MDSPKVYCAYDEMMDIVSLIPNPRNPNQHPEKQIELLAKIIKNQGWRAPITISNRSGFIVRGHGRLMAAKKLGLSQVPVDRQDYANEAEEWADLIADNRISELSQNDDALLKDLLEELDTGAFDMDLTGFDADEIEKLMTQFHVGEVEEDDFDAEKAAAEIKEPVSKPGDVWKLGRHRLMCGDSTKTEDVAKLMDGEKADMVFTDPPYGVDYQGGVIHGNEINKNHKRIKLKNDDTANIYHKFINNIQTFIKNGPIYIFYATKHTYEVFKPLKENDINIMSILVWIKKNTGYADMNSHYKNRYEPCIYAKIGNTTHFVGPNNENTTWEINKDRNNKLHPTQKPIDVPYRAIKNHNVKIIADAFAGSGSTLIACEQLNRICYMMELDPIYVDVIIKRWEQFTGQKAELVG